MQSLQDVGNLYVEEDHVSAKRPTGEPWIWLHCLCQSCCGHSLLATLTGDQGEVASRLGGRAFEIYLAAFVRAAIAADDREQAELVAGLPVQYK